MGIKKGRLASFFINLNLKIQTYLFITYIVTSKPKRISVAAGLVHMLNLLKLIIKYNTICDQII